MAEELPPAVAKFIADVSQYVDPLQRAIDATQKFKDQQDEVAAQASAMADRVDSAENRVQSAIGHTDDAVNKLSRAEDGLTSAADRANGAMDRQVVAEKNLGNSSDAAARAVDREKSATDELRQSNDQNTQSTNSNANTQSKLVSYLNRVTSALHKNKQAQDQSNKSQQDAQKTGLADMNMLQKIWLVAGFATGSLEPLAAGLIAVTGGLASGLSAATIGLGVFGAVAKSNLTTASTAATAVQQAQTAQKGAITAANLAYKQQIAHATTAAARTQALTTKTQALQSASQQYASAVTQAYAQLSPAQIALSKNIGKAQNEWQNFVQSNTSGVSKIISQGIGLLPRVFQLLQPFMVPVEHALSGFISDLQRAIAPAQHFSSAMKDIALHSRTGLSSQQGGLAQFLHVMAQNAGPALSKILKLVENLAGGFGHLLEAFMPFAQIVLSGLDQMTAGFSKWAAGLSKTVGFQEFMVMVKTQGPTIVGILKNLAVIVTQVIKDMSGSASNMLWMKVVPQILAFTAAFMKANPHLVEMIMNVMLVVGTLKQLYTVLKVKEIIGFAQNLGNLSKGFRDSAKAADEATGAWGTAGGKIKSVMNSMKTTVVGWGGAAKTAFGNFKTGFNDSEAAASEATGVFGSAGGAIRSMIEAVKGWSIWSKIAAGATKVWTGIQAAFDVVMDANPIMLVVIAIAALVAVVIICYIHFAAFRNIVNDVGRALRDGFMTALHAVMSAANTVIRWLAGHWPLILGIILGPVGLIVAGVIKYWHQIYSVISSVMNDVINVVRSQVNTIMSILDWFGNLPGMFRRWWDAATNAIIGAWNTAQHFIMSIPGMVWNALSVLYNDMLTIGKNIIIGLINGMASMAGQAVSYAENIGKSILSSIGGFLGIHSPSTKFFEVGTQIMAGLAGGISGNRSMVTSAMNAVQSDLQLHAAVTAASPALASTLRGVPSSVLTANTGGQPLVINLSTSNTGKINDQVLWTAMQQQTFRYNIRNSGVVTGGVKPGTA